MLGRVDITKAETLKAIHNCILLLRKQKYLRNKDEYLLQKQLILAGMYFLIACNSNNKIGLAFSIVVTIPFFKLLLKNKAQLDHLQERRRSLNSLIDRKFTELYANPPVLTYQEKIAWLQRLQNQVSNLNHLLFFMCTKDKKSTPYRFLSSKLYDRNLTRHILEFSGYAKPRSNSDEQPEYKEDTFRLTRSLS